jgi:HSP20 family molecular chaperone IbpA
LATDSSTTKLQSTGQHFAPRAFIQENEFGYVLHAVLPGVKAKDIVAELLSNRRLLISGVRFSFQENGGQLPEAMKIYHNISSDPFILSMKEEPILPFGRFKISWELPEDADPESLRAKVEVQ